MTNVHNDSHDKRHAEHFWPTTWRLISYLKPWTAAIIIAIILAIGSTVLTILAPKVLGQATTIIYQGLRRG